MTKSPAYRQAGKLQINSNYQIPKYLSFIEIWCLFDYWYLEFGYFSSVSYFNAL
jgi:hypothetical protein